MIGYVQQERDHVSLRSPHQVYQHTTDVQGTATPACRELGFLIGEFQDEDPANPVAPPWLAGIECEYESVDLSMCERAKFGQTQFCGRIQRLNCFSTGVCKVSPDLWTSCVANTKVCLHRHDNMARPAGTNGTSVLKPSKVPVLYFSTLVWWLR